MDGALAGRRIVVPETREIELLAAMLEKHGAAVVRCPMVAILDPPDPAPVVVWIERFVATPPDDLILFTGEGLLRLNKLAATAGLSEQFVAVLAGVRKITRGPKPARRLRELGLKPDLPVEPPTTAGIIAALSSEDLHARRVAVQLYPDNPHTELLGFLHGAAASVDPVLPYAYASAADDARVREVIGDMEAGRIDLVGRLHQFAAAPPAPASGTRRQMRGRACRRARQDQARGGRPGCRRGDRSGGRRGRHRTARPLPSAPNGQRHRRGAGVARRAASKSARRLAHHPRS
jgi:uroporphyrinogen-III synthase